MSQEHNVSLGSSRFNETFYRVFWFNQNNVILGVVHQFLKDTQLPVTQSYDILGLISRELKFKKYIAAPNSVRNPL